MVNTSNILKRHRIVKEIQYRFQAQGVEVIIVDDDMITVKTKKNEFSITNIKKIKTRSLADDLYARIILQLWKPTIDKFAQDELLNH